MGRRRLWPPRANVTAVPAFHPSVPPSVHPPAGGGASARPIHPTTRPSQGGGDAKQLRGGEGSMLNEKFFFSINNFTSLISQHVARHPSPPTGQVAWMDGIPPPPRVEGWMDGWRDGWKECDVRAVSAWGIRSYAALARTRPAVHIPKVGVSYHVAKRPLARAGATSAGPLVAGCNDGRQVHSPGGQRQ